MTTPARSRSRSRSPSLARACRAAAASLVCIAFWFASTPAHAQGGTLEAVRSRGVLRWGGDMQGGEPYVSQDPSGKLVGFEVELADALAKALGVRAEFVQADWSSLVPSLERSTFDIAMNGLEVTEARRERVSFSLPYYRFALRLVAREGDTRVTADLARLSETGRLRVGTLTSSMSEQSLRGRAEIVLYEGVQEPYIDLEQGRTDAVLLDDIIAARYGARPGLRVVGDVGEGAYAIGMRRDDLALTQAIDGALKRVAQRGELEAILRRSGIWNERQRGLALFDGADGARDSGSGSGAGSGSNSGSGSGMTSGHVMLFLRGAAMTLLVSSLAMLLAVPLGLGLALSRLLGPKWAAGLAHAFVEVFRGTPVLLQLYVLYFGLAPVVRLSAVSAAVLGLGLNYAAYESEVHRAAVLSVPRGQLEAATVLGMSRGLALRRIVLPQALRVALPGSTNDFIALLKDSSLVSVITVVELTKQMTITAVDVRGWLLPGLLCAAFYFAMSYPLSRLSARWEARLHERGQA